MLKFEMINNCPICQSSECTEIVYELLDYPLTELFVSSSEGSNSYDNDIAADQQLAFCSKCVHAYLTKIISPEFLYSENNYHTATSKSEGSISCIDNFSGFIGSYKGSNCFVIDIGGNDSTLLAQLHAEEGCIIDPNASERSGKYECINNFLESINPSHFHHKIIDVVSSHTLEHIKSPHTFFSFVASLRNVRNVYIQVPCIELMVKSGRYDLIHHQHLQYFSLESFELISSRYGFSLEKYEYDFDHYGTLRVHLNKCAGEIALNIKKIDRVNSLFTLEAKQFTEYLQAFRTICDKHSLISHKLPNIYCYGASLMLPIIYYYYPFLRKAAKGIYDADKNKSSLRYANYTTPIIHDDDGNLEEKSIFITAVATRSAHRSILKKIISRNALNIISPFGAF